MSLAAMVLTDRVQPFMRYYDTWMRFITGGQDAVVRAAALSTVQPGERLLDVGCGTGSLAIAAARCGARVVGIDRSRSMLTLAREKAIRAGVSITFRQGRLPILPLPREAFHGAFDVATATFTLSELSRDEAALAVRSMSEAVRPGGRVIIADEAVPGVAAVRLFAALQRLLFAVLAFTILQKLAPTRRHPLSALLEESGLMIQQDTAFGRGALRLVVAERPAVLPASHRAVMSCDTLLPKGVSRVGLRIAAWFALPIPVASGVYRVGAPGPDAPVLLTGNYFASVEAVQCALVGRNCYLIVEDTGGWNVWCASDAELFTAEKAVALMRLYDLEGLVLSHRIIIPRLGGRIRTQLATLTQWEVVTGPIEARDLPSFLDIGELTPAMRSLDRLYRLRERMRIGALTMMQVPLFLLPFRALPSPLRRSAQRFAVVASWVLPLFHYLLPGRTGIVKSGILGCGVSLAMVLKARRNWARALTVMLTAPLIGWIYQSSSPVIYWKRIWK